MDSEDALKEAAEATLLKSDYVTDEKLARIRQDIDFAEAVLNA